MLGFGKWEKLSSGCHTIPHHQSCRIFLCFRLNILCSVGFWSRYRLYPCYENNSYSSSLHLFQVTQHQISMHCSLSFTDTCAHQVERNLHCCPTPRWREAVKKRDEKTLSGGERPCLLRGSTGRERVGCCNSTLHAGCQQRWQQWTATPSRDKYRINKSKEISSRDWWHQCWNRSKFYFMFDDVNSLWAPPFFKGVWHLLKTARRGD